MENLDLVSIIFKMIKIAHIQLLPLLSGVQRVCLDELIRLDENKFDKYLICKEEGPLTVEAKKYGIKCLVVRNLVREISLKNDLKALWSLWKIIKQYKFDIVHTHSSKTGVLGRVAAWLNRTNLIVHTVHGFSFPI
ncbi:glycosyltransferase family 4 protein, partial [Salmonella enterica]|nr:glycosyltransferase family 4 protein [Salmonella enterica]